MVLAQLLSCHRLLHRTQRNLRHCKSARYGSRWASFALIGILYYLVPKMRGKEEVYSKRLASIHFWATNIFLPLGIVVVTYLSFVVDSLVNWGISEATVMGDPATSPLLTTFLVLFIVGLVAQ